MTATTLSATYINETWMVCVSWKYKKGSRSYSTMQSHVIYVASWKGKRRNTITAVSHAPCLVNTYNGLPGCAELHHTRRCRTVPSCANPAHVNKLCVKFVAQQILQFFSMNSHFLHLPHSAATPPSSHPFFGLYRGRVCVDNLPQHSPRRSLTHNRDPAGGGNNLWIFIFMCCCIIRQLRGLEQFLSS